jgi:hypothetical protein
MSDAANRIVQKLWSYCHVLRDDGLSYQDYLEQLTFLLFLKMADERARLTGEPQPIPAGYRWADLAAPQQFVRLAPRCSPGPTMVTDLQHHTRWPSCAQISGLGYPREGTPNKPMKLTVACGARSLSARRKNA